MNRKSLLATGFILLSTSVAIAHEYDEEKSDAAVYRVEMHNQTDKQWFSPCLCALHNSRIRLFQEGQAATTGQATFSEDGFNGILAKELQENPNVYSVLQCGPGLTPPDSYRVEYIKGPVSARLTCAAMPVTTNDVLTVIQRVKLPKQFYTTRTYRSKEWDLGSEQNNYSAGSMPEDSVNLIAEGSNNPVTIADSVVFGSSGRPVGVPALLNPFSRAYIGDQGEAIAEGTMSLFTHYEGSDDFNAEIYGWMGSASYFSVTRIE